MPSVPRNDWNSALNTCLPPRHWPIAPSWSHTTRRGSAPNCVSTSRWPPSTSWAWRVGIIHPPMQPGEAADTGDHPQLGGLAVTRAGSRRRAATDRTGRARPGNRSCADTDPAARTTGAARPPGRAAPGSSSLQPIRSAITVAGIAGNSRNNSSTCRLHGVDDRPRRRPLIARRPLRPQRRPHRVARHTQPAGDRLDPHPLRPMQPTDLSPLVHVDHSPCLLARLEPGSAFHHIQWWTRHRGSKFGCR